jgi:antitoxin MazE
VGRISGLATCQIRAELVRIGNSRGVRIPKPLIEQCGLGDMVELRVENDCLVISPERQPRQGWEEAFRAAGPAEHDELLLEIAEPNEFDRKEWQWKAGRHGGMKSGW